MFTGKKNDESKKNKRTYHPTRPPSTPITVFLIAEKLLNL